MEIGIFARTFARPDLDGVLDAVADHGLHSVQFNLACAGLPSMPDQIDPVVAASIRDAHQARDIQMVALSGTFNMIHPDRAIREDGLRRLGVLAGACATLGTRMLTLCTGTRDPNNMWRRHPDNDTPAAWDDLLTSMRAAVAIADAHDVTLGIEPEVANVVDSARKARRLLDEIGSPRLRIVIDGANLFHRDDLARMHAVLDEAFDLLGPDIALAHAKDLREDGAAGHEAAGTGLLDYDYYIASLRKVGFDGPLILHSLAEEQVPGSVQFLREKLRTA